MAPSSDSVTVALRNLPQDFESDMFNYQIRGLISQDGCSSAFGPIVDTAGGTRSSTCTIAGRKCERVAEKLNGLEVTSNRDIRRIEADKVFYGLTPLADSQGSSIDFYFIHGLGGHAFDTWSSDIQDGSAASLRAWPRDFLPQALEREGLPARVSTIGYNANTAFSEVDVSGTIETFAQNLLGRLQAARPPGSPASTKPMYFVCHSLGGLVVCKLLNMVLSFDPAYAQLATRHRELFINSNNECLIKGVVFLGTPFKGSTKANQIKPFINMLASLNPFPMNSNLISELRKMRDGNNDLALISNATNIVLTNHAIEVLVGYETTPIPGTGRTPVSERDSALGIFKNRVAPILLNGDHRKMVKFHQQNNDYLDLQSRIIQMVRRQTLAQQPPQRVPLEQDPRSRVVPAKQTQATQNSFTERSQRVPSPGVSRSSTHNVNVNVTLNPHYNARWTHYEESLGINNPIVPGRSRPLSTSLLPSATPTDMKFATDTYDDNTLFSKLAMYDTVFILDDTSSMQAPIDEANYNSNSMSRWDLLQDCLANVIPQATRYDPDGVDVYFLKSTSLKMTGVKAGGDILSQMEKIKPLLATPACSGGTSYLSSLREVIEPRLALMEQYRRDRVAGLSPALPRSLNLIVITDGQADDMEDVEHYIVTIAEELDEKPKMPISYIGIQFLQVGNDTKAAEWLGNLDDNLKSTGNSRLRDIVDTTPYQTQANLSEDGFRNLLVKCLLGGIKKEVDREKNAQFRGSLQNVEGAPF